MAFYAKVRPFLDAVEHVLNSNTFLFRHIKRLPPVEATPLELPRHCLTDPEFGRLFFSDDEWNPFFSDEPGVRMDDHDFIAPETAGYEAARPMSRAEYLEFLTEMLCLGPNFSFSPYGHEMKRQPAAALAASFLAQCEALDPGANWRYLVVMPEVWNWLCRAARRPFNYSFDGFGLGSVSFLYTRELVCLLLTNGSD